VKRCLLLAALIPCAAAAADRQQVFGHCEYIVSVDKASIERSKGSTGAWVQQHFLKGRHSGNSLNGLNAFDCKHKKVTQLRVAVY
jgi:hypothetical protein